MGIKLPDGYIETSPGVYERRNVRKRAISDNKDTRCDSKPKRAVRHESLATNEGKETYSGRIHIRLTIFRKRLLDPDNAIGKYAIDCLRYAGVLSNDREEDVTIETRQEKTKGQEETVIELFKYKKVCIFASE